MFPFDLGLFYDYIWQRIQKCYTEWHQYAKSQIRRNLDGHFASQPIGEITSWTFLSIGKIPLYFIIIIFLGCQKNFY